MAGRASSWRLDMGTGFGATRPRPHPTPLPAEPGRGRSRPAWRYGSLRASAAAGFSGPGTETGKSGDCVWSSAACGGMGRSQGCGTCEAPGPWRPRGLLGRFGADLGRPLWLSLARWAGLRFCRQPAFGAGLPRRAKENAGGIHRRLVSREIRGRAGGVTGLVRGHSPRS